MSPSQWTWVLPGMLANEEQLLENAQQTKALSIYYTSTMTVEKRQSCWKFVTSVQKQMNDTKSKTQCKAKIIFSNFAKETQTAKNPIITVSDDSLQTFLRYETCITLYEINSKKPTKFISSVTFVPSQLKVTYKFSLKLKYSNENAFRF